MWDWLDIEKHNGSWDDSDLSSEGFFFSFNVFELSERAAVKERIKLCGFIQSDRGRI